MTITWDTDCDAPGCPGKIVAEDGRDILVDRDWDYPGIATSFGWSINEVQRHLKYCADEDFPCDDDECYECKRVKELGNTTSCEHSGDGTVDCKRCGVTASEFISAAYDWLMDNDGATAEDPGYFEDT